MFYCVVPAEAAKQVTDFDKRGLNNIVRKRIAVLQVQVDSVTMTEAVERLESFIQAKSGAHLVATANAEMVMLAEQDAEMAKVLREASLVVPDGAGVVWAARHYGQPLPERVAGYDLAQRLLAEAAKKGYRVFMFGAAPGVAASAKEKAEQWYPGLQVVGVRDGFFGEADEEAIIAEIKAAQPDVLLVALGVPKQEKWLNRHLAKLNIPVCIGVGGTFDVMAGRVKRAPVWMQKSGLEWSYRLFLQPQRIIRMMALPRFVLAVLLAKKD